MIYYNTIMYGGSAMFLVGTLAQGHVVLALSCGVWCLFAASFNFIVAFGCGGKWSHHS